MKNGRGQTVALLDGGRLFPDIFQNVGYKNGIALCEEYRFCVYSHKVWQLR